MSEPSLLRIPLVSRSLEDLLGVAAKINIHHAVLLGQREDGSVVFLTTNLSTAEANFMVDKVKSILFGPSLELVHN